jgi:lipopolysaccharide/colanic/teichoic acid biosynthesis glycosyltransferase
MHPVAAPAQEHADSHIHSVGESHASRAAALAARPAAALVPSDARPSTRRTQPALKRGLDVTVAVAVLVFTLPLIAVVALAIVLESRGPVFYRAERVGRGGRPLWMLKFRKMARDAAGLRLTTRGDRRLTRVGAVLARTKLDELPQFINVLRGDMSLVGPRPEDPGFVAMRRDDFEEILKVRPGVTGLAQIAFADEPRILSQTDPVAHYLERILPQKCALDRLYIRNIGLGTDLRILKWTAVTVFLRHEVAVHRVTGRMNVRRRPAVERPRDRC